jgi:hypothetical protein
MDWHFVTYYAVLCLTAIVAHWRGSSCEQIGAWVAVTGSVVSTAFNHPSVWGDLAISVFVTDLFVLTGFWSLALFSRSFWPYWATGWQLVGILVHIQRGLFDDILEKPYALLSMYIAYPILGVILAGSLFKHRQSADAAHLIRDLGHTHNERGNHY